MFINPFRWSVLLISLLFVSMLFERCPVLLMRGPIVVKHFWKGKDISPPPSLLDYRHP